MASDEIVRRFLEAASQLPNHGRYVHQYKALEPITGDIRLVKLWPGTGDTTIRCETIHASFDGSLSYEALSYTWGEKGPVGVIDLNGWPFPIRSNLADALRHLRLKDKPRTLWIDALCIDQINVEERNTQVGRMRDIYKSASRVLVFLGQAADDSDMAMDLITGDLDAGCEEAEMPQSFELDFEQTGQMDTSQENASNRDRDAPDAESISPGGEGIPTGGDCLQERLKFQRSSTTIQKKKKQSLEAFNSSMERIRQIHIDSLCPIATDTKLVDGQDAISPGSSDIRKLSNGTLLHDQKSRAENPRDKIFALVGLTPEKDRLALSPDYSKSTAQVYAETTKHVITSTGCLDILSYNTNSQNTESPLPSWVSDWRLRASRAYPLYASDIYHACGGLPACVYPPSVGPSSDLNSITLGGILIDRVSDVSEVITLKGLRSGYLSELRQLIRKLEHMLLQIICRRRFQFQFPFTNAGDLAAWRQTFALDPDPRNSDQFWRTLIANRTITYEAPAPAIYAEIFEMLFYQCDNVPARRVLDEGLRSRTGLDFPRLQTAQPSRIPVDYRPGLPEAQRMAHYTRPLVTELIRLASRVLFVTEAGRMGIAPEGVRSGDKVVILMGGDMPFIVRDRESNDASIQFISESYVHVITAVSPQELARTGNVEDSALDHHLTLLFPFMLQSACLFQSIMALCRSSILISLGQFPLDDIPVLYYRYQALTSLMENLKSEQCSSDANLLTISMLLTLEYLSDNTLGVSAHLTGLKQLASMRTDLDDITPWRSFVKRGLQAYESLGSFMTGKPLGIPTDSQGFITEAFAELSLDGEMAYPHLPFEPDLCIILAKLPPGFSEVCLSSSISIQTISVLAAVTTISKRCEREHLCESRLATEPHVMFSVLQRLSSRQITSTEKYITLGLMAWALQLCNLKPLTLFHDPPLRTFVRLIPTHEMPESVQEQQCFCWISMAVSGALNLRSSRIPGAHLVLERLFAMYPSSRKWDTLEPALKRFFWNPTGRNAGLMAWRDGRLSKPGN
ncbi:hypothetical protein DV736_g5892, partial [Chaetothyriales sp. CBS 134916]